MEFLRDEFVALLQVIVIDLVLAGDNAIIVGLAASRVAPALRSRVIFWGIAGAVVLRIAFAAVTVQLLAIIGLTLAGGILLLWVCWKMYREITHNPRPNTVGAAATADETVAGGEAGDSDERLVEALRRPEHVAAGGRITHVNAAHLRVHRFSDTAHDNLQGLVQAAGGIDLLNDFPQDFQHGVSAAPGFGGVASQRQRQLFHRPAIDLALEGDHLVQRIPVADPLPVIELRLGVPIHLHCGVILQ